MSTNDVTHIFRVSLTPQIYRVLEIHSEASLYDLAEAILNFYVFDLDHAFGFYTKTTGRILDSKPKYEIFADRGEVCDALSVDETSVAEAFFKAKHKMTFLYDYGDNWRFLVEVIGRGRLDPSKSYPLLISSAGKAPLQYPPYDEVD